MNHRFSDPLRTAGRALLAALAVAALTAAAATAQTGLQMNGTSQHVTFGAAPSLGVSTFTVECWFKRTGAGATASTGTGGVTAVPLVTKGRGEADGSTLDMNFFLGLRGTDSVLVADYEEGTGQTSPGLNHPIAGVTPVRSHVWYHAAVTFDGTTLRLYLNGNLESSVVVGAGRLPQSASLQHAALGTAMTSTGVAAGFFAGALDEPRVWNVARTQAEIQAGLAAEATGAEPGLVGAWLLNEGAGATAGNAVAGGVTGTLVNAPSWVAGAPYALNYGTFYAGTNGYVTFGNNAALGLSTFTIETWFRRDGAGIQTSTGAGGITDAIPLMAKGRAESDGSTLDMNWFLGLRGSDGVLVADFEEGAGGASPGLNHPIAGVTPVLAGSGWHHAAATYDGTTWALYLDGQLEATLAVGQPPQSASVQHASLASALNSTGVAAGFFHGALDEARVWSTARTLAEIQADANQQLAGPVPGLVARWGMNEAAGTVVASTAGGSVNGTLTGTGANWTAGAPFNLAFGPPAPPADPTLLAATPSADDTILVTWADQATNETSYVIERSTAGPAGPFTPLATLPANTTAYADGGLAPAAEYCYRVRAENGAGASGWAGPACATTPAPANRALDFAGAGRYVTFGAAPSLNAATFTIECWFRRDGAGATTTTGTGGVTDAIPLVSKGRGEAENPSVDLNWFLGLSAASGVLAADFEEGAGGANPSLNHPVFGTTPIPADGRWRHAAATYDGNEWVLYLDGCEEARLVVGRLPASATTQHASIATALTSTGAAAGSFDGAVDEVRVWSVARSAADIRAGMLAAATGAEPGLLGRWGLDEALGSVAKNSVAGGVNGALVGAPARDAGAPFGDPEAPAAAVLSPNGGEHLVIGQPTTLTWSASDCFGVTSVDLELSRAGPGGPWEPLAAGVPNTGSFAWTPTGPATTTALLRVTARDAAGNAGADLSDATWEIFDLSTPTLVALFSLEPGPEGITVRWQLTDASAFASVWLERGTGPAGPWSAVGAPVRTEGVLSSVLDREVENGRTYWYRLAAIARDGRVTAFGPIAGTAATVTEFALGAPAPNPTGGPASVTFALPREARAVVRVLDVQGRVRATLADGTFRAGLHRLAWNGEGAEGPLPSGIYFVRADLGGRAFTKRIVVGR
uniref:T9SS type A sorting domain-containing protein n=1 Tax=Eiseniibacteriota bacterium TaxID=2212470 RepID=A0A832MLD6_UNCEI